MYSSEPVSRNHVNLSTSPKGSGQQKRKSSVQHQQSSGWGWPRFVSVEVDVEEKRRQKRNDTMPVNATAELSRPEQGARNQSFQKAHEHISYPRPHPESPQKQEHSNGSNNSAAFTAEDQQAREDAGQASPSTATEGRASRDTHTEERTIGNASNPQAHEKGQGSLGAGQNKLPSGGKKLAAESPQSKASAEPEESRKDVTAEQADLKREAERLPSLTGDSVTQDKRPHGSSVSSRPQENDATPGAFPEYDDESVYSEVSSDREDARQPGAENRASSFQPETVKDSAIQNQDDHEDQPAQESHVGLEVQPTLSIQPEDSETGGKHFNEELEHLDDDEEKQPGSSTDLPRNFPVHEAHENVGPVPKPPSRLRGTSSASAKADTERWLNSSLRQQAPIAEILNTSSKDSAKEEATHESAEVAFQDRMMPDHGAGGEEAIKGPKIAQPLVADPTSVPSRTDHGDNEEKGRSVLKTKQGHRELAPASTVEELTVSDDPETSHESKQHGRRTTIDASPNIKADQAMESRRNGSQVSNPEPADVIRRVSTMPISLNARKSSKAAKTVTLPPPKIFVQSPSEVTQDEPIDPHPTPAEPVHSDEYRIISRNGSVVSVQHTVRSAAEKLGPARTGKRKLYLRKVRNLATRRVFLNATLGRKVGSQTKDRLRRLARGEEVPSPSISTERPAADSPPLKKRKSFIRKARNLAARQVILDAALGRQVGGETKPALRRLANGESIVFDEG